MTVLACISLPGKKAAENEQAMTTKESTRVNVLRSLFVLSSGAALLLTGTAKLCSASGSVRILATIDPVLGLQFRHLMFIAGALELAIGSLCLFRKFVTLAVTSVAWLATNLLAYRLCMWWVGWHRPCRCLGNFTDAMHISPQVSDNVMKGVLAYLLFGSYVILLSQWLNKRKEEGRIENEESTFAALRRDEGDKAESGNLKAET
jgi:hypothetical protein